MQSFNVFFGIQLGVLVLRHTDNQITNPLWYNTHTCRGIAANSGAGSNWDLFCIISTNVV